MAIQIACQNCGLFKIMLSIYLAFKLSIVSDLLLASPRVSTANAWLLYCSIDANQRNNRRKKLKALMNDSINDL